MSDRPARRALFLGGARSGKSTLAEHRLAGRSAVTYVAPGPDYPDDAEWAERVRVHRRRRPPAWTTLETSDLVGVIADSPKRSAILIDCLTLWLTAVLEDLHAWELEPAAGFAVIRPRIDALTAAVAASPAELVLVSNEVGSGIVPPSPSVRMFRDLLGVCNAAVAASCDDVYLVVAGLPITVKGEPT